MDVLALSLRTHAHTCRSVQVGTTTWVGLEDIIRSKISQRKTTRGSYSYAEFKKQVSKGERKTERGREITRRQTLYEGGHADVTRGAGQDVGETGDGTERTLLVTGTKSCTEPLSHTGNT